MWEYGPLLPALPVGNGAFEELVEMPYREGWRTVLVALTFRAWDGSADDYRDIEARFVNYAYTSAPAISDSEQSVIEKTNEANWTYLGDGAMPGGMLIPVGEGNKPDKLLLKVAATTGSASAAGEWRWRVMYVREPERLFGKC